MSNTNYDYDYSAMGQIVATSLVSAMSSVIVMSTLLQVAGSIAPLAGAAATKSVYNGRKVNDRKVSVKNVNGMRTNGYKPTQKARRSKALRSSRTPISLNGYGRIAIFTDSDSIQRGIEKAGYQYSLDAALASIGVN